MDTILECRGIEKSFGGVHALKKVNFSLNPGEVHALVGENGAGKTTLIKIISGALSQDRGEIFYLEKAVNCTCWVYFKIHIEDSAFLAGKAEPRFALRDSYAQFHKKK